MKTFTFEAKVENGSLTLPAEVAEALGQGQHMVEVTVNDRDDDSTLLTDNTLGTEDSANVSIKIRPTLRDGIYRM